MFYKLLLLLMIFSSQAVNAFEEVMGKSSNGKEKSEMVVYSCIGSKRGKIFSVKATSTEYIILSKRCFGGKNNTKATSTEYIILLIE